MSLPNDKIIPISEARSSLSKLVSLAKGDNFFLLTRGGKPKAALVDIDYLEGLVAELKSLYQKTYINPKLLPLTRKFSGSEIKQWEEEDQL